ncbi:MAG: hypothetical protein VKP62_04890 [Candidatus Sericytochromatia bacterium]|nr:hypothetical protein [Candidatus Sericytochromatia bacterium]
MTLFLDAGAGALDRDEAVDRLAELVPICNEMLAAGLPKRFAITAMAKAVRYEGLRHLLQMWREETDSSLRDDIVADLAELLEDLETDGIVERPSLRHRDVDSLITDVRAFKDALRCVVDRCGGISWLAERSRIPQPSLSRFFNSTALPQRGTLLKLREALTPEGTALIEGWLGR